MYSNSFIPSVQHKTKCLVCTAKGINPLSGELQLASDLDFYIDGVSMQNIVYKCCQNGIPYMAKHLRGKIFAVRVENGYSLEKFCCSMLVDLYYQLTRP